MRFSTRAPPTTKESVLGGLHKKRKILERRELTEANKNFAEHFYQNWKITNIYTEQGPEHNKELPYLFENTIKHPIDTLYSFLSSNYKTVG